MKTKDAEGEMTGNKIKMHVSIIVSLLFSLNDGLEVKANDKLRTAVWDQQGPKCLVERRKITDKRIKK